MKTKRRPEKRLPRNLQGPSIEEVILKRKLDGTDPSSWPVLGNSLLTSKSQDGLRFVNGNSSDCGSTRSSVRSQVIDKKIEDRDKELMMDNLRDYCRSLEDRIDVRLFFSRAVRFYLIHFH